MTPSALSIAAANLAYSTPVWGDVSVFWRERVSVLASVCSLNNCPVRLSTPTILVAGYWFKVIWVHTGPIAAQVVKVQPVRNRAKPALVEDTMRCGKLAVMLHPPVPASLRALPYPTGGRVAAIFRDELKRRQSAVMATNKAKRLSLDASVSGVRLLCEQGSLATTTLAQAGRIQFWWGRLGLHSGLRSWVSRTRLFKQRGCISLSQVYQNP